MCSTSFSRHGDDRRRPDDDESELIENWHKLTDAQREELRKRIAEEYVTPEILRDLVRAMLAH